jgi:hypothetical protein
VVPHGKWPLKGLTTGRFPSLWLCRWHSQLVRGNFFNILRDCMINAMRNLQRLCETKCLTLNPLKTNVTVFTRKLKPKPIKPLRLRGEKNYFHLRSYTRP